MFRHLLKWFREGTHDLYMFNKSILVTNDFILCRRVEIKKGSLLYAW